MPFVLSLLPDQIIEYTMYMAALHPLPIPPISQKALAIRRHIITLLGHAESGHSAGALGLADIFAALYFAVLKHDPKNPDWQDRDRVILSNGHTCPVLYATLAEAGYFPKEELFTFRQLNSRLQGHPHLGSIAGVENSSGPLGQGLSIACGIAYGQQMDQRSNRVFCILSDAELQEGQTWEACLFAAKYHLHHLVAVVDRNNIQISGTTEHVMPLDPVAEKFRSFNWNVLTIDGHRLQEFITACAEAEQNTTQPTVILCDTIPGKGVRFMEHKSEWHGKPPSAEEAVVALAELGS